MFCYVAEGISRHHLAVLGKMRWENHTLENTTGRLRYEGPVLVTVFQILWRLKQEDPLSPRAWGQPGQEQSPQKKTKEDFPAHCEARVTSGTHHIIMPMLLCQWEIYEKHDFKSSLYIQDKTVLSLKCPK